MTAVSRTPRLAEGGADRARAEGDNAAALARHASMIARLRDPAAYPRGARPVDRVDVIETHISTVLLAGEFAYKLKKPVDLGFADFSTPLQRRHYCHEEIRLNRRHAPGIYLDVVPVTAAEGGNGLRFGGTGTPIDFAVRMRRFDQDARLDALARRRDIDAALAGRIASVVAGFHATSKPAPAYAAYGRPEEIHRWARDNLAELRRLLPPARRPLLAKLAQWTETEFARRAATFLARVSSGRVRECHGDLHLANLVLVDGEPLPFDCIEFNAELRYIDVMSDVAFLWMDLLRHRLPDAAAAFLTAYLENTGDYAGLATLRFYAVYRALVRAKVELIRAAQRSASKHAEPGIDDANAGQAESSYERYLEVAAQLADERRPLLVAMCGVSGSGKTTVSRHLLESLGAVRIRSDIERKRLAGIASNVRRHAAPGEDLYTDDRTRFVYDALARAAVSVLDAGLDAVVDATFQRRADRESFRRLAERRGARYAIVLCEATPDVLHARVTARMRAGRDASDATPDVLAAQLASFEAPAPDEASDVCRLDTGTDATTLARRCADVGAALSSRKEEDRKP